MREEQQAGLRIFISYRRKHASVDARRLHDSLVYRFGLRQVFMDLSGIEAGEDFVDVLAEEIGNADVFLAVVDPLWA
ncbi:MAG TPA: toll/interleukin-1 receptor domain-containing protein, partial [Acidimicrobiales bacterium]|nr:toll/interleukin-1 receptor domain-containing protein [Acidimicrobiales bacterium]